MRAFAVLVCFVALVPLAHSAVAQDQCRLAPSTFSVWADDGQQATHVGFATAVDQRGVFITADHVVGSVAGVTHFLRSSDPDDDTRYPIAEVLRPSTSNLVREDWALLFVPEAVLPPKRLDLSYDAFFGDEQPWVDSRVNAREFKPIQWSADGDTARGKKDDQFACPEPSTVFIKAEDYQHGDSGSSVVNGQCSLLGITSAFRNAITDDLVQSKFKENFATLLKWVESDPPNQTPVEPLSQSITSLLEELTAGDTAKAGRALGETLSVLDDLNIVVVVPVSCALGLAAKRLVFDEKPLFDHLEPDKWIKSMERGGTARINQAREFLLEDDGTVTWLSYLETMRAYRLLLEQNGAKVDWQVRHRMDVALRQFASKRELSYLHRRLEDLLPDDDDAPVRADSSYLPRQLSRAFIERVAGAKTLSDVQAILLSSEYDLFSTEQGTRPVEYGVELLNRVPKQLPADDAARELAADDLAEAISMTLGGLHKARESGVGDRYVAQRARDLALMVQRWRRLFSSPGSAPEFFAAERWLALFAIAADFRDATSWGTAFLSFEDERDPVAAWYLRSIEIYAGCLRHDGCRARIEAAQLVGTSMPFTVGVAANTKCKNALELAFDEVDWYDLEKALGIPGLREHYQRLDIARADWSFEEELNSVLNEIDAETGGRFILPFPCAPLTIQPSSLSDAQGDGDQLGAWVGAATLPAANGDVPLPLKRPTYGSLPAFSMHFTDWDVGDDLRQA